MAEMEKTSAGPIAKLLIKICISVSLLGILFYKIGVEEFFVTLGDLEIKWLIVSLFLLTLSNLSGSFQWHLLLNNSNIMMRIRRTIAYYYTGLFFNNFLLGFFGGDILRIYDIIRHSGQHSVAISTVFLDRLIGLIVMCCLAGLMAVFTFDFIHIKIIMYPLMGGFLILVITVCFFYFKGFAKKFQRIGEQLLPLLVQQKVREIYNAINYFRYHKLLLVKLIVISIGTQSLRILTHYAVARSLQITLSWQIYFVLIPVVSLITIIPVSIGGLGVREQSGVVLFRLVGLPAPEAFAMQLLTYFINIICSIPGGGVFIFRKHGRIS